MAYYEFKCKQCGKAFTVKQSFAEHDRHRAVKCPTCHSARTRQLFSRAFAHTAKKS